MRKKKGAIRRPPQSNPQGGCGLGCARGAEDGTGVAEAERVTLTRLEAHVARVEVCFHAGRERGALEVDEATGVRPF